MLANIALAVAALAVIGTTEAQTLTSSNPSVTSPPTTAFSSATTTTRAPKTTTIAVGASGFKFSPNNVTALPGDTVEFLFFPDGHWVIRAEYGYPCIPFELVEIGRAGFSSGAQAAKAIVSGQQPKFQVLINDTEPIFFYCGAPGSCFKEKMIGAINPNETMTLEKQLEIGRDVDFQLVPGEAFPTESGYPMPTVGGTQPHGPAQSNANNNNKEANDDHSHLSAGAIAGIAIGSAAVLVMAGGLVYLCGRRGGFDKAYRKSVVSYQFAPPPVVEAQYKPGPKSPEPWNSQFGGVVPPEAYRDQASPPAPYGPRSPPISPQNIPSYGYTPNIASPLMSSVDGGTVSYYQGPTPPPQPMAARVQHGPPVELPTSGDPGNSPLPSYQSTRQFSWAGAPEAQYRPAKQGDA